MLFLYNDERFSFDVIDNSVPLIKIRKICQISLERSASGSPQMKDFSKVFSVPLLLKFPFCCLIVRSDRLGESGLGKDCCLF